MLIDVREVFVVQTRPRVELAPSAWCDVREFEEDGPTFDWADYMLADGDTEARVVRHWR